MCSINEATNSLKQTIKTLTTTVEKLDSLPAQEKVNHPLYFSAIDIEQQVRIIVTQTEHEVNAPTQAHQSADKNPPAPSASA